MQSSILALLAVLTALAGYANRVAVGRGLRLLVSTTVVQASYYHFAIISLIYLLTRQSVCWMIICSHVRGTTTHRLGRC